MAKDGKHVIHAGGVFPNPLLNREGRATAVKPGTLGFFDAGVFKVSVDGSETAIIYVADFDYLRCKTVDDTFAVDDLLVGIHPLHGMFLNVRAAAGTYKKATLSQSLMARLRSGPPVKTIAAIAAKSAQLPPLLAISFA